MVAMPEVGSSSLAVPHPSAYKLLLSCPAGLSRRQVSVDFSALYDRVPHPDINLEESIKEIWSQRVQQNKSLYNGIKFRYGGHSLPTDQDANVCLHLGLTDYRTFVGTNLNPSWAKFLVYSEDDYVSCQHISMPLGNGAIVETSDKRILLLKRSHNVGEFPGYFVFPGGHSEPHEVGISTHQSDKDMTNIKELNEKVSQEMFDGIIREVVEEIGVPATSLTDPIFIGVSHRELNVRPTAFFFLNCNLDSQQIQKLYSTAQDGYESTHLYAVSRDFSNRMTFTYEGTNYLNQHTVIKEELEGMSSRMPGCHHGGLALYILMQKVQKL